MLFERHGKLPKFLGKNVAVLCNKEWRNDPNNVCTCE
jgi:hypothetical protein